MFWIYFTIWSLVAIVLCFILPIEDLPEPVFIIFTICSGFFLWAYFIYFLIKEFREFLKS